MELEQVHHTKELKSLILNSNEPFLIKKRLKWELLDWSLDDWGLLLKNERLKFRYGKRSSTKEPQWERTTANKDMTFEEFVSFTTKESDNWMYFDYKYLREWFRNVEELKKNIDWSNFGFPNLSSEDSTIWIGSTGAHTPCHVDTYGCNLIAQIYGRKQWILCPPEEDLKPSRIPYEESSIYSKLNFFSPNVQDFEGVKNCRKIILEPGDVLFVPHKWWHYVENLETAISVNVWLPLPSDDEERLNESLVQLFMAQIAKNLDKQSKEFILNPNSDEAINSMSLHDSADLIKKCKSFVVKSHDSDTIECKMIEDQFQKSPFLQQISIMSPDEFRIFLQAQKNRFSGEEISDANIVHEDLFNLINAFTHPDTISLIKNKLCDNK